MMPDAEKDCGVSYVEDVLKDEVDNRRKVMGTVKLTEGEVVYIPAPTTDPRGDTIPFYIVMSD